jgi:hypothetical protein
MGLTWRQRIIAIALGALFAAAAERYKPNSGG